MEGMATVIDTSTGEVKSQLALFEGYVMEGATLHLTAGVDIPLSLSAVLRLGETVRVSVEVGDSTVTVDARVTKRTFALEKGQDGDRIPVTRHVLVADPDTAVTS